MTIHEDCGYPVDQHADYRLDGKCVIDLPDEPSLATCHCAEGSPLATDTLSAMPISEDDARELSRAARMADTWRQNRDRLIRKAHANGGGLREIARLVGLTHRAVSKIVAKGDSDDPSG